MLLSQKIMRQPIMHQNVKTVKPSILSQKVYIKIKFNLMHLFQDNIMRYRYNICKGVPVSFDWQGPIQSEAKGAMSPPTYDIHVGLIVEKKIKIGFCDKSQLLYKKKPTCFHRKIKNAPNVSLGAGAHFRFSLGWARLFKKNFFPPPYFLLGFDPLFFSFLNFIYIYIYIYIFFFQEKLKKHGKLAETIF